MEPLTSNLSNPQGQLVHEVRIGRSRKHSLAPCASSAEIRIVVRYLRQFWFNSGFIVCSMFVLLVIKGIIVTAEEYSCFFTSVHRWVNHIDWLPSSFRRFLPSLQPGSLVLVGGNCSSLLRQAKFLAEYINVMAHKGWCTIRRKCQIVSVSSRHKIGIQVVVRCTIESASDHQLV